MISRVGQWFTKQSLRVRSISINESDGACNHRKRTSSLRKLSLPTPQPTGSPMNADVGSQAPMSPPCIARFHSSSQHPGPFRTQELRRNLLESFQKSVYFIRRSQESGEKNIHDLAILCQTSFWFSKETSFGIMRRPGQVGEVSCSCQQQSKAKQQPNHGFAKQSCM